MALHRGLLGLVVQQRARRVLDDDTLRGSGRSLASLLWLSQLRAVHTIGGGGVVTPPVSPTDPATPPPVLVPVGLLGLAVQISTTSGWLSLEDVANGYELHADSFAARSTGHRKVDITSGFLEGTFTVRSVREEITEQLVVWVSAASAFTLDQRITALIDALSGLNYQIQVTSGTLRQTWTCGPADYSIESSQPLQFATTAVVRATVPRLPGVTKELVSA